MSSPSKAKGYAYEKRLVDYLRTQGAPHAERIPAGATADRGDITGTPGVVWECKDQSRDGLPAWVDECETEMGHARAIIGAVIHHRRGNGHIGGDFATMRLDTYLRLLRLAGYLALPESTQ